MGRRHLNHLLIVVFFLVVAFVLISIFRTPDPPLGEIHSLKNWQAADAPVGYPVGVTKESKGYVPEFDPRFVLLDAFERYELPLAKRFESPMGSETGALTYNAQPFGSDNPARGGAHTGDDLNGIGGMNTDLADPVYAVGDGSVLYAGEPSPGWGKTVIVGHRREDGSIHQSMYAHLHRIDVPRGGLVSRGQQLGTVGTAGGRYPAHLHFEMRASESIDFGAGYTRFASNRLDPGATVDAARHPDPAYLAPAASAIANEVTWEGNLILENAHLLPEMEMEEE
jgi:murein DD-endopeptidase MepM/ murein hydrolase activator NlpD